jgi:sulfite exporter TauE/SafE
MTEVWLSFLAGLAGSPHCLGMCGGIVAAIALHARDTGPGTRRLILLTYNLGRIFTYALLGAIAGFLGASLDVLSMKMAANWVFVAANLFVLLVGMASLAQVSSFSLFSLESAGGRFFSGILRWAVSDTGFFRTFILGMTLGFLPCGLVYAPLIAAAASGRPGTGAAMMAALGLGTLPMLFFFGTASAALSNRLRGNLSRLVGLFVALIGFTGLWRVLGKMGYVAPFPLW